MKTIVKYLLSAASVLIMSSAVAQKPKPVNSATAAQKTAAPKLVCSLGSHSDTASVFLEEMVQLVTLPIKVTDDKKNVYPISSYQLIYKRRAVTEDEETGKVTPIMSNVSNVFSATPLPAIWKKILTEQMRPGEELFFFDIVAKDAQGRLMFAPDLRIKIK